MSKPSSKETILVVDDDLDLLEIIVEQLQAPGRQVLSASNGPEALRLYLNPDFQKQNPIEAVISDMNMPEMSGLELLLAYKAQFSHGTFLFLTGFADKMKMFLGMKYGAYDFMEKPCSAQELSALVAQALKMSKIRFQVENQLPEKLAELGFAFSDILRLHRKFQRICDLESHLPEPMSIDETLSHFSPDKDKNLIHEALRNQYKQSSLAVLDGLVSGLPMLDQPLSALRYLRQVYQSMASFGVASLSFGHEDLGQSMDEMKAMLLYLRGFPQLFDKKYFNLIRKILLTNSELFKGSFHPEEFSAMAEQNSAELRSANLVLASAAFKLV